MIFNKLFYMIEHLGHMHTYTHTHTHSVLPKVTPGNKTSIEFSHARSIKLTFNCLLSNKVPVKQSISSIDFPNSFSI